MRRFLVKLRKHYMKPLAFSLAPALMLLGIITVALDVLEHYHIINTKMQDDSVAYSEGSSFHKEKLYGRFAPQYQAYDRRMLPIRYSANKGANTFRMFILGESFAMGTPFEHQNRKELGCGGMDSWIREDLESRYPSRDFDILNAATGGANSGAVLSVFKEIIDHDPDFLFVAMGNNEGYIPPTRLNPALHNWSVYRGMRFLMQNITDDRLGQRPLHSPQYVNSAELDAYFRENLQAMIDLTAKHGVPLAVATMPVNLKYDRQEIGPHLRIAEPKAEPSPCLISARKRFTDGLFEQALQDLSACQGNQESYLRGQVLEQLGRYEQAREAYLEAIEFEPKNRCRPSINRIIRELTQDNNVILIDLERAAFALAPNGIPGDRMFLDYCHMTWPGYRDMGLIVSQRIIDLGIIKGQQREPLPRLDLEVLRQRVGLDDEYLVHIGLKSVLDSEPLIK